MIRKTRQLLILGTRGIPAQHGGFETFAEKLSVYLVKNGWCVTVYCQQDGNGTITKDCWVGVNRVNIPVQSKGALATIVFDWKSTIHALRGEGLVLTLGYNTAIFSILYRLQGKVNLINMDGMEWQRVKWNFLERTWLYVNERIGCWVGNHLIADHPEIGSHLVTRVDPQKVTMIPYGADDVIGRESSFVKSYSVESNNFSLMIARGEPENSILDIVKAFSSRKRNQKLLVLGKYDPDGNEYHQLVFREASDEVLFPGAIYNTDIVNDLRFHCRLYIHGHTVGGTNPSLVEAMGAGSAVLAHDNKFNRWVAGSGAGYFCDSKECADWLDAYLLDEKHLTSMKEHSQQRFGEAFTWKAILSKYEQLLESHI